MLVSRFLLPVAVAAVVGSTAAVASAQTPQTPTGSPTQDTLTSGRPFRGIFGSGVDNREQTLTFTGSLGAGYETEYLTAAVDENGDMSSPGGGGIVAGSGTLSYSLSRSRASISASATASAFYFNSAEQSLIQSQRASASQSLQIARRTRLTAGQYISRAPFRLDRLFPGANEFSFGAPPALPGDQYSGADQNVGYGGRVDVSQQISENVWMSGGYTIESNHWDESNRRTYQGGRFGIGVSVARGLSVRAGYGYYESDYQDDAPRVVGHHNIDAGIDYSGAISLSRRTSLSFSTGSTAIHDSEQTHFNVIGRAELTREIGRTWAASGSYRRDAYYVDEFSEITMSDSLMFSLGGLLNRRVSFHSGVGVTSGNVGFSGGLNNTHAAYTVAGITTALSRQTAIGLDYNFYMHFFGADVGLPEGVLREANRHAVRAYFTVWTPLMSSARSLNASR